MTTELEIIRTEVEIMNVDVIFPKVLIELEGLYFNDMKGYIIITNISNHINILLQIHDIIYDVLNREEYKNKEIPIVSPESISNIYEENLTYDFSDVKKIFDDIYNFSCFMTEKKLKNAVYFIYNILRRRRFDVMLETFILIKHSEFYTPQECFLCSGEDIIKGNFIKTNCCNSEICKNCYIRWQNKCNVCDDCINKTNCCNSEICKKCYIRWQEKSNVCHHCRNEKSEISGYKIKLLAKKRIPSV